MSQVLEAKEFSLKHIACGMPGHGEVGGKRTHQYGDQRRASVEEENTEPKAGSWKPGVESISKRSRLALPNDDVRGAEHHTGWLVQHG